jgi:hypothetical protein
MNSTIKAIMRHMVPPAARAPEATNVTQIISAQWQDGLEASGRRQRKLRLVFAGLQPTAMVNLNH